MKTFITDNFLLHSDTAGTLYHDFAEDMPIVDYHSHLSPLEIAQDRHYRSITELWLEGDHYKWRAMRTAGINENLITGYRGKPEFDKEVFHAWASVVPQTLGNPLYHWTHLELLRYFGVGELLSSHSADKIYDQTNTMIADNSFSTQNLIKKFQVKFIGTTDDPIDSLEYHKQLRDMNFECQVKPSWRPDKIIKIEWESFSHYIEALGKTVNIEIRNLHNLIDAVTQRMLHFENVGCSIADHGLDEFAFTKKFDYNIAAGAFEKALSGNMLNENEILHYKSWILTFLGQQYSKFNWVMQLHIGALRNNNSLMLQKLGPDSGFDSINDKNYAPELSAYLDTLNSNNSLPKTILYCLNPRDNEMMAAMIGNFQGGEIAKIQFGSGWWFNDQKDGMYRQMNTLAALGLLPRFVGMLTDSRSFLSFPRHEYFRRILCNLIGTWVEQGEAPNDLNYLGTIIKDICYNNAVNYFNIE